MTDPSKLQADDRELIVQLPVADPHADERDLREDNVVLLLPGTSTVTGDVEQPLVVRLREALDASGEIILVVEQSGRVLFANRMAQERLGLDADDPVFRSIEQLLTGDRRREVWHALEEALEWRGELSTTRSDGSTIHLELALLADRSSTGDVQSLTVIAHDVGERRALQDALEHRTNHDGLTGLANRQHLLSQVNALLPELADRGQSAALMLVDIDEFRTVTNSLGHEAGDRVLVAFAYRLLRTFPTNAVLARVGGDEFAVFCPGERDVDSLAELMQRTTAAPFYIDGSEVHLSVVTGIALTTPTDPAPNGEALLREADAASYRGKERGRGSFEVFEPGLQTQAVDRLSVVQDLRRALRNNELRVHYQPKIALSTGTIIGVEALMRWAPGGDEIRSPASFMDVAEDTGLIIPMGRWMIRTACEDAAELQAMLPGDRPFEVSVNLSVRQLEDPSLVGDVEDAIAHTGVDPEGLEFEITESALMDDVGVSALLLTRLKALGTRIAVDDFGTGYSSLQYLQRLPVDVLKVDRAFVSGLDAGEGDGDGDRAIVSAVVQLAHALRLRAVAEGVETPGQLDRLRFMGCDQAQGYHIARPMPREELDRLLHTTPRW